METQETREEFNDHETRYPYMNTVENRFYRYISIDTTSAEDSPEYPSTPGQWTLARMLKQELMDLNLKDVTIDEYGYVFGTIPGNVSYAPTLAFLSHMDTSDAVSGADICARTVLYEGGDVLLNEEKQLWLRRDEYPELARYEGQHLIVTDGTTLLGSDDKAGIAEIITAAQYLMTHPDIPHGTIRLCFTPDEEIGEGTKYLDLAKLNADYGYTVDGGALGEFEYENFNAASARIHIHGKSMHTGTAKGRMKNSLLIAMELAAMLPQDQQPALTDHYEGFFHFEQITGNVEQCSLYYLIRDHDKKLFQDKKKLLCDIVSSLNNKYGDHTVELELRDTYYNMEEIILKHPILIDHAKKAFEAVGIQPDVIPIRGCTDGARLSYKGLPCPNLSTGGHNFHSVHEFIPKESMEAMVQVIVKLAGLFADSPAPKKP